VIFRKADITKRKVRLKKSPELFLKTLAGTEANGRKN
jgi:hypothetical protein